MHAMKPRRNLWIATVIAAALALVGCGSRGNETAGTPATGTTAASLDAGPRAIESDADESRAELGEQLFKDKGCSACHAFGQRVAGPDLAGVTRRRTAKWIENQILHPEQMVKEDPIARQLFAQFALQMPNQRLTPDEAKTIIEYFKHKDHEAEERD
jgi:mono/diheme cytochrome c family protein